jgi:hypothetical protein
VAVDGFLNFDTKINTSGFKNGIKNIASLLDGMKGSLKGIASTIGIAFGVKEIIAFSKSAKEAWNIQLEAETKLETVLGRNLGATKEQIQAVKDWSSELQNVGVIGDEVQLSGLQELSTYIESADSLKKMNVVLNDMLAQQYGLNATAESAVTISTMLGKVLEGQTSALSRYGYSFTEAQEQLLKYGTEEQKVATLADVVEASVGGMNEALAKTPAGKLKQVENTLGDIKELAGKAVTNLQSVFIPVLENVISVLQRGAELAVKFSESFAKAFGVEVNNSASLGSDISASIVSQNKLTDAVAETGEELEKNAEIQKNNLAGFDKINTISSNTAENNANSPEISEQVNIEPTADESAVEETAEETADGLAERIKRLLEPVKLAWDANFPQLAETANQAKESLKSIFADISESIESVWTNGTGEKYVSNIIRLFTQIIGIIGDVSNALDSAWNDGGRGTALVQSYFDAWNSFLILLHETGATFRLVWNDGTGEEICGNILEILTNINDIAENLQTDFWIAWNTNHNGERILSGILGIFNGILSFINRITKSTAEWAKRLDFSPLLGSVADLLESLKPLTDTVFDALAWAYEKVLLPLGKWTIEKAVPVIIGLFSSAIKVLTSVINLLKPVAEWLIEKFLKPIASWTGGVILSVLSYLSEKLDTLADLLSGKISFKEFIDGLNGIEVAVGAVVTAVGLVLGGQAIAGLISVAPVLLSAIVSQTSALIPLVAEWVALNLPIIAVTGAVAGVIAIGVLLIKHWDEVKEFAEKTWESIKKTVSSAWNGIKSAWSGAKDWFAKVWTSIQLTFSIAGKWFKATFALAWENVKSAWSNAVKWFSDLWSDIKSIFSIVGNWFSDRFCEAWNGIVNIFCGIGSWFGDRWNDIANIFWQVGNWFSQRFWEAWENITNIFSGHNVWTFFNQVWTIITNVFSHVSNWFRDTFSSAWEAVKNVFSSGGAVFMGIVDGIFNTFKTVVNALIDGINWVVAQPFNALNGALDGMRGIEIAGIQPFYWLPYISIPQIPYLAQGTVVPANYGEFLAVLGDNKRETEVVSPLSTIEQAVANAMKKSNSEIHVHVELDGREIGRVAVKAVNENNRRKGG